MSRIFLLSDPHLGRDMSHLHERWADHVERMQTAWDDVVGDDDIVLLPGDISWSRGDRARADLEWISARPGRLKVLCRGNHDWWWTSGTKARRLCPEGVLVLDSEATRVGNFVFAGTKGYTAPGDPWWNETRDRAPFERNIKRLEKTLDQLEALVPSDSSSSQSSLISSPASTNSTSSIEDATRTDRESAAVHRFLLLHYPPWRADGEETEFFRRIVRRQQRRPGLVSVVVYGHFHSRAEWVACPDRTVDGIRWFLGSADKLNFRPLQIWP